VDPQSQGDQQAGRESRCTGGGQEDAGAEGWMFRPAKGCKGGDSEASPRSIENTFQNKIGREEGAPVLQGTGVDDG
jgi:hypothetical protein